MESTQTAYETRESLLRIKRESTLSTCYDNKTSYTDHRASRIVNLIQKSINNKELNYNDFNENYEAYFKPVN